MNINKSQLMRKAVSRGNASQHGLITVNADAPIPEQLAGLISLKQEEEIIAYVFQNSSNYTIASNLRVIGNYANTVSTFMLSEISEADYVGLAQNFVGPFSVKSRTPRILPGEQLLSLKTSRGCSGLFWFNSHESMLVIWNFLIKFSGLRNR